MAPKEASADDSVGLSTAMKLKWAALWLGAAGVTAFCALCAVARVGDTPPTTLHRRPIVVSHSPYEDDLRRARTCGCLSCPSAGVAQSPDGIYVASTTNMCRGDDGSVWCVLVGHEHCFVHDIQVTSTRDQRTIGVLTVRDHEPGSGSYHQLAWSKDSKALLIYGFADLPDAGSSHGELCMIYEAGADKLNAVPCPEIQSKPDSAECRQPLVSQ
jgi:hypothetical protein